MVVGDGRRHGRRARRRDPRARRRARCPRRPTRVPARVVVRHGSGARRRAPRPVAFAGDEGRERAGAAHRADVERRRRRVLRSLLVLRELAALRVRRARHRARRSARAHRHRRPAVPRRPRERVPHALDRGDGRAAARAIPAPPGSCQRRRDAHDEARVRRLLDDAGPGTATARQLRTTRRPRRVVPTYDGDVRVAAYSVVHGRDGTPEWGLLVCDVPDGTRAYAQLRDRDACASAEHDEFVGTTVRLEQITADGPMGAATVNIARI